MNQVNKAIIMAAGQGKRLQPVTMSTPKPLITVNGIPMIESVITGLLRNHINNIYIVVGYLKEQFYYLADQYNEVSLIENPYYNTSNNISSLYAARNHLENAMILDGDQIIYNDQVLSPDFERSGYNAVWVTEHTDEWLLQVKNNIITACSRNGGRNGWQLYSISRWNQEDGQRLKNHLEIEFEIKKNHDIYWDDVVLFCYPEEYCLGIQKMQKSDILEIDSLDELIAADPSYQDIIRLSKNRKDKNL